MATSNAQLLIHFYSAFQNKDYKSMRECYDVDAVFSDEIFRGLDFDQISAMWEMLLSRSKDLKLTFENVVADEIKGSADWTAAYTFSKTGKRVVNNVKSNFIFNNGKILQHTDNFNFNVWAQQALGFTGKLLGWTDFLKQKTRNSAMKSLEVFMRK